MNQNPTQQPEDEMNVRDVFQDNLRTRGRAAVRDYCRYEACDLAGEEGEKIYRGKIRTPLDRSAVHETHHALARFRFLKGARSSIAIWDDENGCGGCCGPFSSLAEAREKYGTIQTDQERTLDFESVLTVARYANPTAHIRRALGHLFCSERYSRAARRLIVLTLEKGFLDAELVDQIIATALGARL